jgi:hypothetical protein
LEYFERNISLTGALVPSVEESDALVASSEDSGIKSVVSPLVEDRVGVWLIGVGVARTSGVGEAVLLIGAKGMEGAPTISKSRKEKFTLILGVKDKNHLHDEAKSLVFPQVVIAALLICKV